MIKLRLATADDVWAYYGHKKKPTMRAIVADLDGEILGIAGLMHDKGNMLAFSDMKDQMHRYPITIMKAARLVVSMMNEYGANIIAKASCDEKNACAFLEHIGFTYLGDHQGQRCYEWVR